jgi:hypothetical protein
LITYENMNMKWNELCYGAKSYFKLVLNKLKLIRIFKKINYDLLEI